nr:SH3 domain-containing protein [Azospirillum oleiclasticum]
MAARVWATESVYVRAAPDPRARIVDGLVAGDALERLGVAEDGWVRVGRDGREIGYVAGRFVAATPPKPDNGDGTCALPEDLPDRSGPAAPAGTVMRALAAANLRAAPACDARVLDVLEAGAAVTVTGHADGWYEVRGPELPRAFVGARLLRRAQPGGRAGETTD